MPTGYTAPVQSGEITTLEQYALGCARAFGALVTMRDEPGNAPIPKKFEPQTKYYDDGIAAARATLAELTTLAPDACEVRAAADFERRLASFTKAEAERSEQQARYRAMLDKVNGWSVPDALADLRRFMAEQLSQSIDFDGYRSEPPKRLTGEAWRAAELEEAGRRLTYLIPERDKEIRRTDERNAWIAALRASLTP